MSADLLIHATLTVSGDSALLPAADARIKALLVGEIFEGGFEEHHGDDALSYDFKVRGGVPFPASEDYLTKEKTVYTPDGRVLPEKEFRRDNMLQARKVKMLTSEFSSMFVFNSKGKP